MTCGWMVVSRCLWVCFIAYWRAKRSWWWWWCWSQWCCWWTHIWGDDPFTVNISVTHIRTLTSRPAQLHWPFHISKLKSICSTSTTFFGCMKITIERMRAMNSTIRSINSWLFRANKKKWLSFPRIQFVFFSLASLPIFMHAHLHIANAQISFYLYQWAKTFNVIQ